MFYFTAQETNINTIQPVRRSHQCKRTPAQRRRDYLCKKKASSPAQGDERTSVRACIQYFEQGTQGVSTEASGTASREEPSTVNMAVPQLEEATSQGTSASDTKEAPSKEEAEIRLRLHQRTAALKDLIEEKKSLKETIQDLQQSATEKIADLQKQLEEQKMQNESQKKVIENQDEEEAEIRLRLRQRTAALKDLIEDKKSLKETIQDLQQNTTEKIADLQKQLEEQNMQNETQIKVIENQDEELRKERDGSEILRHNLTTSRTTIKELQADVQAQRQTNTDLQQQLSSAHAAIEELRDSDEGWKTVQKEGEFAADRCGFVSDRAGQETDTLLETIATMQQGTERHEQLEKELPAALDEAEEYQSPQRDIEDLEGHEQLEKEFSDAEVQLRLQLEETAAEPQEKTERIKSLENTVLDLEENTAKKLADLQQSIDQFTETIAIMVECEERKKMHKEESVAALDSTNAENRRLQTESEQLKTSLRSNRSEMIQLRDMVLDLTEMVHCMMRCEEGKKKKRRWWRFWRRN